MSTFNTVRYVIPVLKQFCELTSRSCVGLLPEDVKITEFIVSPAIACSPRGVSSQIAGIQYCICRCTYCKHHSNLHQLILDFDKFKNHDAAFQHQPGQVPSNFHWIPWQACWMPPQQHNTASRPCTSNAIYYSVLESTHMGVNCRFLCCCMPLSSQIESQINIRCMVASPIGDPRIVVSYN
jgi:hypothetical protein